MHVGGCNSIYAIRVLRERCVHTGCVSNPFFLLSAQSLTFSLCPLFTPLYHSLTLYCRLFFAFCFFFFYFSSFLLLFYLFHLFFSSFASSPLLSLSFYFFFFFFFIFYIQFPYFTFSAVGFAYIVLFFFYLTFSNSVFYILLFPFFRVSSFFTFSIFFYKIRKDWNIYSADKLELLKKRKSIREWYLWLERGFEAEQYIDYFQFISYFLFLQL